MLFGKVQIGQPVEMTLDTASRGVSPRSSWFRRVFDPTGVEMDYNAYQSEIDRQFNAQQAQLNRDFQSQQADLAYLRSAAEAQKIAISRNV